MCAYPTNRIDSHTAPLFIFPSPVFAASESRSKINNGNHARLAERMSFAFVAASPGDFSSTIAFVASTFRLLSSPAISFIVVSTSTASGFPFRSATRSCLSSMAVLQVDAAFFAPPTGAMRRMTSILSAFESGPNACDSRASDATLIYDKWTDNSNYPKRDRKQYTSDVSAPLEAGRRHADGGWRPLLNQSGSTLATLRCDFRGCSVPVQATRRCKATCPFGRCSRANRRRARGARERVRAAEVWSAKTPYARKRKKTALKRPPRATRC